MYETWLGLRSCILSHATNEIKKPKLQNLHCAPAMFYTFCWWPFLFLPYILKLLIDAFVLRETKKTAICEGYG